MLEISCYEVERYEVKLKHKPRFEFYEEEKALKFIEENKEDFVYMVKIQRAIIE